MSPALQRLRWFVTALLICVTGMARYGYDRFSQDRRFKYLCLAVPVLVVVAVLFGSSGNSSGSGSALAPPPIIVGPGGGGSGAAYQFGTVQTAPAAPDPASEQRQRRFAAMITAARQESRDGVRCEQFAAALDQLPPADIAQAIPAIKPALDDATACQVQIELSNGRIEALGRAAAAFQAEDPVTTAALAQAGHNLSGLDQTRSLSPATLRAQDQAQAAALQVQESDGKLKALADAASAANNMTLDGQTRLANAAQGLEVFDIKRLPPAQKPVFEAALRLADRFAASDRRIHEAIEAGTSNATDTVKAVGALQPLDWDRAAATGQKDRLDRAQTVARQTAAQSLRALDPALREPPTPSVDEQASRVLRVMGPVDAAAQAGLSQALLDAAKAAVARIDASDMRLETAATALAAWRRMPSRQSADRLSASYQALSTYDHQRTPAGKQVDFNQLDSAYAVVAGKMLGLSHETRARVPLFIIVRDVRGGPADQLAGPFADALHHQGYTIAPDRANAALVLEITTAIESHGVIESPSVHLETAIASASLRAFWTIDGSDFDRGTARTNGQGLTSDQAVNASFAAAASQLSQNFNNYVETRKKP